MADPSYPAFSIFAFLGFVLVLVPLPWHLQAWNSGTCLFMIWTAIGCLNLFINSIVWHGNIIDWAPIWCDISTRLIVGISVAIPAASLCINRRLYHIASCQTVSITMAHKRRMVMIDLAIGLGIPALQMALQFIVQGHRYDIWGDIGCYPTTVNTPAAYPLNFLWPIVIGLISAVYCILTLCAFMKRRAQFSQFVTSNASLTLSRYFRLMSLATIDIVCTTPLAAYGLYLNATTRPIYPWKSWADIHFDWYTIDAIPSLVWRKSHVQVLTLELSRWSIVFCAFAFFAFFGFADEARKNYRRAYYAILKRLGIQSTPRNADPKTPPGLKASPIPMFKQTIGSLPLFKARPPSVPTSQQELRNSSAGRSSFHRSDYTESLYPSPTLPSYHVDLSFTSLSPSSSPSDTEYPIKAPLPL
ncbi:STE3-like pheromone receptor [Infundibulicybe gibba]|nr:STE3-like pheromone receptor [Infundibulicybe gibba]